MASVVLMINSKRYGMYGLTLPNVPGSNKVEIQNNAIRMAANSERVPARSVRVKKVM